MSDLFSKPSKKEKSTVVITDDLLYLDVIEYIELQDTQKDAKTASDKIKDRLKDLAIDEWLTLYEDRRENPGSIDIRIENNMLDGVIYTFNPSDRYISINETKANSLRKKYGDEIINENTVYYFNNDLVEKYKDIISKLILECDEIPESDKPDIIKTDVSYSIAKGTIDKMNRYGVSSEELFESVAPVVSLTSIKKIK